MKLATSSRHTVPLRRIGLSGRSRYSSLVPSGTSAYDRPSTCGLVLAVPVLRPAWIQAVALLTSLIGVSPWGYWWLIGLGDTKCQIALLVVFGPVRDRVAVAIQVEDALRVRRHRNLGGDVGRHEHDRIDQRLLVHGLDRNLERHRCRCHLVARADVGVVNRNSQRV